MVWNDKTYIGYRHLSLSGGAFHVQVEEELEIPFFGCLLVSLQERKGKAVIGDFSLVSSLSNIQKKEFPPPSLPERGKLLHSKQRWRYPM